MTEQRHIIKRQNIELTVKDRTEAKLLQANLGRIYRQRIVPLIDKFCSELSHPDEIHRIEVLELDLGYIDPKNFEPDLLGKIQPLLQNQLSEKIKKQQAQENNPKHDQKSMSQLELFAYFVRNGCVPWWVDTSKITLLDDCLQHLLQTSPDPLGRLMRELVRIPSQTMRVVKNFSDTLLSRLVCILAPALQNLFSENFHHLITIIERIKVVDGKSPSRIRESMWPNIFSIVSIDSEDCRKPAPFCRALLSRVSRDLGLKYARLISEIHRALADSSKSLPGELMEAIAVNHLEQVGDVEKITDLPSTKSIIQILAQLQKKQGGRLTSLWKALQAILPRYPVAAQNQFLYALNEFAKGPPSSNIKNDKAVRQILQLLQHENLPPNLPTSILQDFIADLDELNKIPMLSKDGTEQVSLTGNSVADDAIQTPANRQENTSRLHEPNGLRSLSDEILKVKQIFQQKLSESIKHPQSENEIANSHKEDIEAQIDLGFSDTDEVYIGNAGLVILWPFLGHFFKNLDLLKGQQFIDEDARQRAVGLLQYLVKGEEVFLEYQLPLNKLLCTMEVNDLSEFGSPLSDQEADECIKLLTAVIEKAPILGKMSVEGFKNTFLQRDGILSTRDGAWLLRVERESYDIVLDRFPWSWEWIKLPWMETAMRVEW